MKTRLTSAAKSIAMLLILAIGTSLSPSTAVGAVKAGAICKRVGESKKISGTTFKCVSQGKKKVWTRVIKPTSQPTPTPTPTPTPSPTPTPTPTPSPTPTPTPTPSPTPTPTPSPTNTPTARSLTIYQGGPGISSGGKKSSELNFTPITAPADSNLKLWVYDPENPTRSLNSPGIFYKKSDGQWTWSGANNDGTVYVRLAKGSYVFDTVEPNGNSVKYSRKTYSFSIDEKGIATLQGLQSNSQGIFTVTIDVRASEPAFSPKNQCQLLGQDGNSGMNNGFPHRKERLPTSGVIRAIMIPVDFPDVVGLGNPEEIYFEMAQGMNEFYRKVSGNQVSFSFEVLPKYLRMNFPSNYYNLGTWSGGDSIGYWKAAIAAADSYVDYSKFDAVYVLSPRNIPWSSIAYGPAFPIKIDTDDGPIYNGSFSGADAYQNFPGASWKWISHETGHLFGLHDLYTVSPQAGTFGSWDLMSLNWSTQAIELNAWNRYISDWLKESQIDCLTTEQIGTSSIDRNLVPLVVDSTGIKAQFIRLSSTQILVIEYRKSGGLDAIPSSNEGVLVYTVDMTIPSIKGGWKVQRRSGSIKEDFTDAALKAGDSVSINSLKVEVVTLSGARADIRITKG
jgi:M6 family metalloprotease-like protein